MTVGISGYRRVREPDRGRHAAAARRLGRRAVQGVDAPTLKEAGVDVALENWRMVAAAPGISDEEKAAITADIEKLATSDAWKQELATRGWDDRYPRRPRLRRAARRRHRGDQGHPDRHRPRASERRPAAERAPPRPGGACHRAALAALAAVIFCETRRCRSRRHTPGRADDAALRDRGVPRRCSRSGTVVAAFRHGFPPRDADRPGPMFWIIGGLVLQMLLLKPLGFSIATGCSSPSTARGFGRGPLWFRPVGIVLSLVIWLIFAGLLNLSLPAGPLEHLFF